MHSSRPDRPLPSWLAQLTAESIHSGAFPLEEILQNSLYYPAAGIDGDPVKRLLGKFHSFVYVDYGYTCEQLTEALSQRGFRGYSVLGRREVTKEELTPNGWKPQPPPSERRRPPSGWVKSPFCSWIVLQRDEPDPGTPHKERFSLLYLCAEGVAAYQALYTSNQKFPACIAVIQPGTGFGGNWTNFTDPDQALYQTIRANPAGRPGYLLQGGNGPAHFYEKPCWPAYSTHLESHNRAGSGRVGLWATDGANSQKSGNPSSDGSLPILTTNPSHNMNAPEDDPEYKQLIEQLEKWMKEGKLENLLQTKEWLAEMLEDVERDDEEDPGAEDAQPVDPIAACAINLEKFKKCHPKRPKQKAIGRLPRAYLDEINRALGTNHQWLDQYPADQLDRSALLALCQDSQAHPLVLYAAIMAWGSRNYWNFRMTLQEASLEKLIELITYLRTSKADRKADFARTIQAAAAIDGLGVSYFTKLMFFLRPVQDAYILDQWTAKSSILLFPEGQIRLVGDMPSGQTSPEAYEWFCHELEELGRQIDPKDPWPGDVVESAMFDERGGLWRAYVKDQFIPPAGGDANGRDEKITILPSDSTAMRLAGIIANTHSEKAGDGILLPPGDPLPHDYTRVIVRCGGSSGACWQYAVNKSVLLAMVQISGKQEERLEKIRKCIENQEDRAIHQVGAVGSTNLTFQIAVTGGHGQNETEWSELALVVVNRMSELYREIAPLL